MIPPLSHLSICICPQRLFFDFSRPFHRTRVSLNTYILTLTFCFLNTLLCPYCFITFPSAPASWRTMCRWEPFNLPLTALSPFVSGLTNLLLTAVPYSMSTLLKASVLAPLTTNLDNAQHWERTVMFVWVKRIFRAKLRRCLLPRRENTVMQRSIWPVLTSSLARSTIYYLHLPTTWKFHLSPGRNIHW